MDILLTVLEWLLVLLGLFGLGWLVWWRLQHDEAGPYGFLIKCAVSAVLDRKSTRLNSSH